MRPVLALLLAACYAPSIPDGLYACTVTAECPEGDYCTEAGRCYANGHPDPARDLAPPADLNPCAPSLGGAGAGDFAVSLSIRTPAGFGRETTLLTQRAACDDAHSFWYLGMRPQGDPYAVLQAPYSGLDAAPVEVNDGAAHRVVLRRRGGALALLVGGEVRAEAPSVSVLDASLPPLEVGRSSACGIAPMPGVEIADVCLEVP